MTSGRTVFEIISGSNTEIASTLEGYLETKDAHSLRVLAMTSADGTTFKVLVRYVEKA